MRNWASVPFYYKERGFYCVEDNMNIFEYWPLKYISEGKFIIKSVPKEDIIEEVNHHNVINLLRDETEENIENELKIYSLKINEIIRKVNQLDKQIKELNK